MSLPGSQASSAGPSDGREAVVSLQYTSGEGSRSERLTLPSWRPPLWAVTGAGRRGGDCGATRGADAASLGSGMETGAAETGRDGRSELVSAMTSRLAEALRPERQGRLQSSEGRAAVLAAGMDSTGPERGVRRAEADEAVAEEGAAWGDPSAVCWLSGLSGDPETPEVGLESAGLLAAAPDAADSARPSRRAGWPGAASGP